MVWALTHVVRPGDSMTLLALLAGGNHENSFISASPGLYIVRRNSLIEILFSQEPDLYARRRTYLSGHILVELLLSRSLWFLGPASHLLALIVHIQRRGKLNKQAIQVDFIESEVRKNLGFPCD